MNLTTARKQPLALLAICLGFFMVIMDATIINVALPTMAKALHTNISGLQWVVAGYTMTFAALLIFSGHLADQWGAKKIFLCGLMGFAITSLLCGLSTTVQFLIAFRLLQGATAALLVPASLALLNALYQDPIKRAKAIGIWGGIGGIAAGAGPVLGAVLTAKFSWPAIFFVNIPLAIITIFLIHRLIPNTAKQASSGFDLGGQTCVILMMASLAFALIELANYAWYSWPILLAVSLFILSLMVFILVEKRAPHPMVPLSFFKNKNFVVAIIIGLCINAGMYGELFVIPLYFQQIRGFSVLQTGMAVFPMVALIALSSFLSGRVASKKGPKKPLLIGLIIGAAGFFSLLIVGAQGPDYLWLVIPLAAAGFGIAFTMPAATMIAIHSLPENRAGMASGIFTTCRQMGSLLGVALFGAILSTAHQFVAGMHVTLVLAGLSFLFALVLGLKVTLQAI